MEQARLREIARYLSLDYRKGPQFQNIVDLAAALCNQPVAMLTILDGETSWIKVRSGTTLDSVPRQYAFCQYVIIGDDILIVEDTSRHPIIGKNLMVQNEPYIRFYAGISLTLSTGDKIGTLCLVGYAPSQLNEMQKQTFLTLAQQAVCLMELEVNNRLYKQQLEELERKRSLLIRLRTIQIQLIQQPINSLSAMIDVVKSGFYKSDSDWLNLMTGFVEDLRTKFKDLISETMPGSDIKALRLSKMVEEIQDYAILLLDEKGNIENWNKGAELLKGYQQHEIIGRNFSVFYTASDRLCNLPQSLLSQASRNGFAKHEGWRVRKDGSKFWGNILITAIHNELGAIIGFTKVTRDLTSTLLPASLTPNLTTIS